MFSIGDKVIYSCRVSALLMIYVKKNTLESKKKILYITSAGQS